MIWGWSADGNDPDVAMSDAELDEWMRRANDDIVRALDETTDTEAGLARVKRAAEMLAECDLDRL